VVAGYRERGGVLPDDASADVVSRRADAGDQAARDALAACGARLGVGLGLVVNLLNPERIVVGGGVAGAGEWFLGPAREEASRRAWAPIASQCDIVAAQLGPMAGAIGAALLGIPGAE